jgi:hypothetical protein
MIVDEIEPIIDELARLRDEINKVNLNAQKGITALETKEDVEHRHMYDDLNDI